MSEKILIKNATIVNFDSTQENKSILIEDGIIKFIGEEKDVKVEDFKVIDACGKYVIPGGIDPHTHFELEFGGTVSVDDFYHGTRAAVSQLNIGNISLCSIIILVPK
jgi:dihydropyrimidinase